MSNYFTVLKAHLTVPMAKQVKKTFGRQLTRCRSSFARLNSGRSLLSCLLLGGLLQSSLYSSAYANDRDKNQTIHLKADTADINQSTHRGDYIGHVDFRQGTTHITAARAATFVNEKNQLVKAIAYGNKKDRAHFVTQTEANKPLLHARAQQITYYPEKHVIVLTGNAEVTQGTNSLKSDTIRYDTVAQRVLSETKGQNRTTIVIHSDQLK